MNDILSKYIATMLNPEIDMGKIFKGIADYIGPAMPGDVKFWFVCKDGLMGWSTEESCKKSAEHYGVEYHKFTGEFGYFKKGAWVQI